MNWRNFLAAAEERISQRKAAGGPQIIEWFVQQSTYEERAKNDGQAKDAYTKEITQWAHDHGVVLRWFNTGADLIKLINTNPQGLPREGDARISAYAQYSHGFPGRMVTDFTGDKLHSISEDDIAKLISKDAFQEGALSILYPCNSARKTAGHCVKDIWEKTTGSKVVAVDGRMNYGGAGLAKDPQPTTGEATWVPGPPPKPSRFRTTKPVDVRSLFR